MEEIAYVAGLFDGEGCVMMTQRPDRSWQLELQLSNCDVRLLEFMVATFGGKYRIATVGRNERRYPCGVWCISGQGAEKAARAMMKYSIAKKEQLRLFLKARATVVERGQRISSGTHKRRRLIAKEIRQLKRPQVAA